MNTSCFSTYKGDKGISIALRTAPWADCGEYRKLAPTHGMLDRYRLTHDEESYTVEYYDKILSKLDPNEVYKCLKDKVLLCWEGKGKFCHRHLVAKWLKDTIDVEVTEL